jgi:DNA-binding GntR family transcriptional regulator
MAIPDAPLRSRKLASRSAASAPVPAPVSSPVPVRRGRATPHAFERLRESIVSLQLAPGTVLSRAALARQLGVSQTPVRDALIRLAAEGLVEVFPQHATVVSLIDLGAARAALFLRRSIELEIVRELAMAPSVDLVASLRASLARQRQIAKNGDLGAFSAEDQHFHRLMYEAARVQDLWHLARRHSGQIDRLRRLHLPALGKIQIILDDHQAIVEAIADRQPEVAQAFLRKHLSGTLANIENLCARFPEYVRAAPTSASATAAGKEQG